eukprot:6543469-Pyramimonas_sp.AAC.2
MQTHTLVGALARLHVNASLLVTGTCSLTSTRSWAAPSHHHTQQSTTSLVSDFTCFECSG